MHYVLWSEEDEDDNWLADSEDEDDGMDVDEDDDAEGSDDTNA